MESPIIIISGPTASGKSAVALKLAEQIQGEIVSADSVQVYKEFIIGAAKVSKEEQSRVPHHLIDICDPPEQFDAGKFVRLADKTIEDIQQRNRVPVIVGGTSMYLTLLLHGLADLPKADSELRMELRKRDLSSLYAELQEKDPDAAFRLHPHDALRIERALEAVLISGIGSSRKRAEHSFKETRYDALIIVLTPPRDELYRKVDLRTELMVTGGLLQETKGIIDRFGFSPPALQTLGYRQAAGVIRGELPDSHLVKEIALYTRRFAKRQLTFWRNEPEKRGWRVISGKAARNAKTHKEVLEFEGIPWNSELVKRWLTEHSGNISKKSVEVVYCWPWQ